VGDRFQLIAVARWSFCNDTRLDLQIEYELIGLKS
jgi:hypothetical protein